MEHKLEKRENPSQDLPKLSRESDNLADSNDKKLERASDDEIKYRRILKTVKTSETVQTAQDEEAKPKSNFTFHFDKPADYKPLFPVKQDETKESSKGEVEGSKKESTEDKTAEAKPFFAGPNVANNFSNLFGNANKSSLFGGDNKSTPSIFGSTTGGGLFGTSSATGLFGNANQSGSIFGNLSNIGAKNNDQDNSDEGSEGEGDEDEKKEETDEEEAKKKATVHVNYSSPYIPIINKPAFNFRVEREDSIGAGYISIEKLKDQSEEKTEAEGEEKKDNAKEGEEKKDTSASTNKPSAYPVLVFRNKTKNILHTSILIPKISNFAYVKNRVDALAITVLYTPTKKDDNDKPKPTKTFVKILFNNAEDAKEFKDKLEELL